MLCHEVTRSCIVAYIASSECLFNNTLISIYILSAGCHDTGTHWWATYSKHHKEKLLMTTSTFDPCFLITTTGTPFGIVGMQTDHTIILADNQFSALEEDELVKA